MLAKMMAKKLEVSFNDETFSVRGITTVMLAELIGVGLRKEIDDLIAVFKDASADKELDMLDTAAVLADKAPVLIAKLISIAAGEKDAWRNALDLPVPVQLDALMKIGELTFVGEHSLKNFVGVLKSLFERGSNAIDQVMQDADQEQTGGTFIEDRFLSSAPKVTDDQSDTP